MIGTLFNTCMILVGSIVGSLLKKGLKEKQQRVLFDAMGLAATGIGINAIVNNMPDSQYPVLFIVSLAVGSIIGTSLDIDAKFQHIVDARGGSGLGQGLSTAILLFCIGTLSILGPIQSAIYGDETFLFTNGTLDLVTSMVLASTYGIGIAIAAVVLFLWQGGIYLGASFLAEFISDPFMTELSIVGGFLIAASGISILKIKDFKTMNLLPSLLVPVIFFLGKSLIG